MSTIEIRHVPPVLHKRLKSRAKREGVSLSSYLLREITEIASRPTLEQMRARLKRRSAVTPSITPADLIGAFRGR